MFLNLSSGENTALSLLLLQLDVATYAVWSQEAVQDPNRKEGMYQVIGAVSFGSPGVWGQCHLGPRQFQASNCVVFKVRTEPLGGFWGESQPGQWGAVFLLRPRDHQR